MNENIYIERLIAECFDNKYTHWYVAIVERAINRASNRNEAKALLGYTEVHHILPKTFCNKEERTDLLNLAYLTAREHFIVHLLLYRMLKNGDMRRRMAAASNGMLRRGNNNQHRYIPKGRTYEIARRQFAHEMSIREVTIETRKRMGDARRGIPRPDISGDKSPACRPEARARAKERFKTDNPSFDPNIRAKISESVRARPRLECPHCHKIGGDIMRRWHFDNCKFKV